MILDIPEDRVESLIAGLDELGPVGPPEPHPPRHDRVHRHRVLQARDRRDQGVRDRPPCSTSSSALDGFDLPHPISLHVNGCPNSCARIQTADIGLKGQLVTDDDGEQVPGLPGAPRRRTRHAPTARRPGLGRTVRGLKVTADGIADYVERVVKRFLDDRDAAADETFAQWAHRADEEALQ